MANLFGKECGPDIYNDSPNNCDPCSSGFSLRKNYILVGDDNNIASRVRLDPTKFEVTGIDCDRKQLTLKPLYHKDLLGLDADDHLQYVHVSISREISAEHLFTADVKFSANPLFYGDPQFTRNPVFSGEPLFSGDPLFTGEPEFQGYTLFSGPVAFKGVVRDQLDNPGEAGQVLLNTGNGVQWRSTASQNVYWVSKSGSDANDGLSETTAKLTIESALNLINNGVLGKFQDGAEIILANKKLIQEESLGFLMTEIDLNSFEFPQEVSLDVKAQAARKVIYSNLSSIVSAVIAQIDGDPDYNNTGGKCERDLKNITKLIANDVLWGGYDETRYAVSFYFDVEGTYIDSIFTEEESALMVTALERLNIEIGQVLDLAQVNYFNPFKVQVAYLIENFKKAIQTKSLAYFPSIDKDKGFKDTLYYARFNIADSIWNEVSPGYPTLDTYSKFYKEQIRNVAIAVAEDAVLGGNSNTIEISNLYYTEQTFPTLTEQNAMASMLNELNLRFQSLLDDLEGDISLQYDYLRDRISSLIGYIVDSISSQTLSGLPEEDRGKRNVSVFVCKRDIGFFIDAVASDLKNGGNANIVDFGEAYFNSQNITYIDGEVNQTLQTLEKARSLMVLAIRGWKTNSSGVLFKPIYSFEKIFINKKVITEDYPACADVENAINTYNQIIQTIFSNGPRAEYKSAREKIFANINNIIEYAWTEASVAYPLLQEIGLTCRRDLGFIVEAIAEDVYKSSNTNMLEVTNAYFGSNGSLVSDGLVGEQLASVFAFNKVRDYINDTLLSDTLYDSVRTEVTALVQILTDAVQYNTLTLLPEVNTGTWGVQMPTFKATINVKSGVYLENNPLKLPPNTAIVGDDLRTTTILAKNRVFDLFHVNNGSKISNVTFSDHLYPSAAVAYPQINGQGVAGIISRSPYIQNCTSKTMTGAGMRVDGRLASGFKSMVLDSYTQYNQGGIGVEIINSGYAQLVSLFTINCDIGISTKTGGQCDLNNSNVSFGNYAMVADGTSDMEFMGQVAEFTKAGSNQVLIRNLGSTKPYNGQVLYFGTPYYSLKNLKIVNPGQGYTKAPLIAIQPPDGPFGTPARARSILFNGKVNELVLLREGRGYTTKTPVATIQPAPPGGVDAQIELQMAPIFYTVLSSSDVVNGYSLVTLATPVTYNLEKGTSVPFFKQSRILASSITLEYVGSGTDDRKSLPVNNGAEVQDNEVDMRNGGSVIFTSTDQSGNFRIGDGVIIDQTTGVIGGVSFSRGLFAQITPLILSLN